MKNAKDSLLWKIEWESSSFSSYLFGTMHSTDNRAFKSIEPILSYIENCQAYAAEYNLNQFDLQAYQTIRDLDSDQFLGQLWTKKKCDKLSKLLKKRLDIQFQDIEFKKPIWLVQQISALLMRENQGVNLDQYLFEFAQDKFRNMGGLEDFHDQLATMQKIPASSQLKVLDKILHQFSSFRKQIEKTIDLYDQGKSVELYKVVRKSSGGMRRILIDERNKKMTRKFIEISREQSLFASVGAAHLRGHQGMLRLLKKAGAQVSPVIYK